MAGLYHIAYSIQVLDNSWLKVFQAFLIFDVLESFGDYGSRIFYNISENLFDDFFHY